jgi:hypothetical protein
MPARWSALPAITTCKILCASSARNSCNMKIISCP